MAQGLEDLELLMVVLKGTLLVVSDGLTKELRVGAHLFAKEAIRLNRRSGPLPLRFILSSVAFAFSRLTSMDRDPGLLPFPVALAGSGLSKIFLRGYVPRISSIPLCRE